MATEVTIITTRAMPSLDAKRVGQQDTMVVFRVDGQQGLPDHVILPSGNPTQQDILNAIRERIKARSDVEGKKFTL